MTYSRPFTPPATTTNFVAFTGMPKRTRRTTKLLMPANGDGSTLSLDFTTGVLDPRLTFTRSSNATFINSQGYVQYADANLVLNSTMLVSTLWTATTSGGGTVTINNDNTVTFASTAGRATWLQSITIQSGLPVTFSIEVTALTNTNIRVSDLFQAGTGFTSQVYNYTDLSGNTTANIGAFTTLPGIGLYTVNATTTATTGNVVFGTDCNGVTRTGNVTMARPQLQYGTRVSSRVYLANSSTSAANTNTPRFDYDPTTLTPRGLLIEGSSDNQIRNSNDIYTAGYWGNSAGISATQDTTITDPSGGTTTCKIVKSAGVQYVVRSQVIPTFTVPANSTVNLTASVWLRMDGAGQVSPYLGIYDAAGASFGTRAGATVSNSAVTIDSGSAAVAAYTFGSVTGWVRCSVSRSFTNSTASPVTFTQLSIYIYPNQVNTNAATIYAWGAQVESGVGPSSLIPTGASQGSRAADSCVMTGTNFSSWFAGATEGVLFVEYEKARSQSGNVLHDFCAVGSRYNVGQGFILYNSNTTFLPTAILWPTGGAVFGGGIATAIPSVTKQAAKWFGGNDVTNYSNGVVGSTGAGTGTVTPAMLSFGANSATGTEATRDWLNACVRRVKFWPTALPDSQIISITT